MDELRCIGCGSIIQSDDPKHSGFVPQSKLQDIDTTDIVCRRCFRLKHYNEVTPLEITQDDFYRAVSVIGEQNALVVQLIDIFDIEGSMIPQISRLTNNNDLILIANKVDLLPRAVKHGKLLHHLKKTSKDYQLKPLDIHIMSALKYTNMDDIMASIDKHAAGRDIYVVGATNVGKSTFINRVLRSYAELDQDVITVSNSAGTTLDLIKIPIGDYHIIDTPGIINPAQLSHYVSNETNKMLTPQKEIKPRGYQLQTKQTLFFGGLARLDFIKGEPSSFICYVSQRINIHRTKLEQADELWNNHKGELLSPPGTEEVFDLFATSVHVPSGKYDLVLPGLGFVTVTGPCSIKIHTHPNVTPYVREALI
jgi:ribosome biogenesis GTPase YqeH